MYERERATERAREKTSGGWHDAPSPRPAAPLITPNSIAHKQPPDLETLDIVDCLAMIVVLGAQINCKSSYFKYFTILKLENYTFAKHSYIDERLRPLFKRKRMLLIASLDYK